MLYSHNNSVFGLKYTLKMDIFRSMNEQIIKSAEIALLGMGTVFVLLTVLVVVVSVIARLCGRFETPLEPIPLTANAPVSGSSDHDFSRKVAAATIAVKKYRES